MFTIPEIAERYGVSEKTVRRRLDNLDPVIDQYTDTGGQNRILLTSSGLQVFDRLMQLEREDKLSPSAAAERVREELQNDDSEVSDHGGTDGQALSTDSSGLVEVLQEQVKDLRAERNRLLEIIESQGEQIRALAPGQNGSNGHHDPAEAAQETEPRRRPSRWRALKYVIFGS